MPHASGEYDSVYGKIATDWTSDSGKLMSLKVTIPPNTSATIYLPSIPNNQILESGTPVHGREENGVNIVETGSGSYVFEVR
jgi:alpha-L-rhamnosidase